MKHPENQNTDPDRKGCGDGHHSPLEGTEFSPTLRRTLERKLKEAKEEPAGRSAFNKTLERAVGRRHRG